MGSVNSTGSKLEKALASDLPEDERYFGLENFGNTCYCNSVLQALYFCEPFRNAVLLYAHNRRLQQQQQSNSPHSTVADPANPTTITNHYNGLSLSAASAQTTVLNGSTTNSHSSSASTFRNAVKGVVNVYSSGSSSASASATAPPPSSSTSTTYQPGATYPSTTIPTSAAVPIPAPADIERPPSDDDTMLTALADLFSNIASQKKRTGSVPPKSFVTKLRQENELFSSYMHQDAHEFLNFILNNIVECLNRETTAHKLQQEQLFYQHQQQRKQEQQQRNPNKNNQPNVSANHVYHSDQHHTNSIIGSYPSSTTSPAAQQAASSTPAPPSYPPPNSNTHDGSNGQHMQNGSMEPSSTYTVPCPSPSSSSSSSTTATGRVLGADAEAEAEAQTEAENGVSMMGGGISARGFNMNGQEAENRTFVHELFEGELSNEVRCLCCETVTQRIESFFDLSVDVEQNSSLTACLRSFSSTELLQKQDKFFCDACCSLQEAERRMRVKRLPRILALHLKRFKYVEHLGKYKKLSYRVVFPLELRLCNTSDDAQDPDRLYSLFAVVVHVGSGPNQGHYVSLIKSHGQWLLFDDDCVEPKDESEIQSVYGITQESGQSTEAGYILFYEQTSLM